MRHRAKFRRGQRVSIHPDGAVKGRPHRSAGYGRIRSCQVHHDCEPSYRLYGIRVSYWQSQLRSAK